MKALKDNNGELLVKVSSSDWYNYVGTKKYVPGINLPLVTSTDLLVAAIIIQKKGKIDIKDATHKIIYLKTRSNFLPLVILIPSYS